jgi:NADPH:quinone reductase-like Zn-dependent oxidoreductase
MAHNTHTMKAALVETNDGAFRLADVARPVPNQGEVLVRIHASGVNPLDTKIRAGAAAHARHPLPAVLGIDLAGVVEAVAPDVKTLRPGDSVYGMTGGVGGIQGTLAEYASVDARLLALKPANLTMREAAALPLVTITAWEGLVDRARIRPGQTLLVQGGGGGVGHIAVQLGVALGATVFATDSAGKAEFIRSMGATPIDYATEKLADYVARHTGGEGFDVVYDTGGGAVLDASFEAVKQFGHVVSCLGWGTHALAPLSFKAGTYSGVFTLAPLLSGKGRAHHGEILREAAILVESGKLVPRLDPRTFAIDKVTEAHAALADRSATGKIVVSITDAS